MLISSIKTEGQRHTISLLVENKFGVLARISGLFSARGYNIDSLSVGITDDPNVSRMTIVVRGDNHILEQVQKQLNKLIDVIKVTDYLNTPHLERELLLVKITATKDTRGELTQICGIFRAKVVDVGLDSLIVEITGTREKNEAFLGMIRSFGIKELCRTGIVAMARGKKGISIPEMESVLS